MNPPAATFNPIHDQLRIAINAGNLAAVRQMIAADPSLLHAIIRPGRNRDYRPLTEAAVECQLEILEFLIAAGASVTEDQHYPLFRASLYDRCVPALELLVRHGADVNGVWDDWGPPIRAACEGQAPACLDWLLDHGAHLTGTAPGATRSVTWNAVLEAAYYQKTCPALLPNIIAHGGDVNTHGPEGETPLHVTARRGDLAGVRLLLDHGADPSLKDNAGRRPLDVTRNKRVYQLLEAAAA
jgi:ankyrin repeat protein